MKKVIGILLILPFLVWGGVRSWEAAITFRIECGGHMMNAANANSIDLAKQEMGEVMTYIESHHLQPGFTSTVYNTPDEDVGFWISNMRSSFEELKQIKPEVTSLERSNVLLKLRETLTHTTKNSSGINVPDGISIYPNNFKFMLWGICSFIIAIGGIFLLIKEFADG